jgi:hypothetical protein
MNDRSATLDRSQNSVGEMSEVRRENRGCEFDQNRDASECQETLTILAIMAPIRLQFRGK